MSIDFPTDSSSAAATPGLQRAPPAGNKLYHLPAGAEGGRDDSFWARLVHLLRFSRSLCELFFGIGGGFLIVPA